MTLKTNKRDIKKLDWDKIKLELKKLNKTSWNN